MIPGNFSKCYFKQLTKRLNRFIFGCKGINDFVGGHFCKRNAKIHYFIFDIAIFGGISIKVSCELSAIL